MEDRQEILSKKKLRDLLKEVDPRENLDGDVENVLLELADEFISNVTKSACQLAKHRQSDTLEVKDLQFALETGYNIRIPGFGVEDRPIRKIITPAAHQQRLSQVKKMIAADIAEKDKEKNVRKQSTRL